MCGRDVARTRRFLVERSVLNVGPECERFGKSLEPGPEGLKEAAPGNVSLAMEMRRKRGTSRDVYSDETMQYELVQDFASRIQSAREKKGLTRQQLGARVGEREVTITRIEAGGLRPTDEVVRRIERELGILLFQRVESVSAKPAAAGGMTLGDMLRDALAKKKPEP